MSGLVTFFADCQETIPSSDPLSQAVDVFLKGEDNGEALIFSLLENCGNLPIESPQDLIHFYRTLVAAIFLRKSPSAKLDLKLRELIKKGKIEGFWKSFQLQEGYRVLVDFLLDGKRTPLEIKQLEKGAILQDHGMHSLERHAPHPNENAQLALVCLYLGWVWQDDDLLQKGLKITEFCLTLCDHEGCIFQGMWTKESDYKKEELTRTFALLFSVASHVSLSSKIQVVSETLFEEMEDRVRDPFISLFARAFQTLIEEEVPFPKIHEGLTLYDHDQSLGFLRYQHGEMSLACAASGINTGLGAIHKKGIHINSFGPHYAPLADSNCYGIFRPSNGSREGFNDLTLEPGVEKARFRGWTRVVSPAVSHVSKQSFSFAHPGDQWLFFDVEGKEETVKLTIRQNQFDETAPLFFVFFVSAEKGVIEGEQELLPKALERFQGRCNKILFEKDGETVTITPHFDGEMQVIPLAGKDHFWSADFLLAFPMMEKMKAHSWDIE